MSKILSGDSLEELKKLEDNSIDAVITDPPYGYFDLDKWAQTLPFLIVPKASKGEKNKGLETFQEKKKWLKGGTGADTSARESVVAKNHHPTVKPLKLMSYLITLFSREGDTVLDPFVGSGTTVIAAKKLGRIGIGIEREAEYAEIAKARLEAC